MTDKLTKQDAKFIEEVVRTGNQTSAARKAYGIENANVAGVKANRALRNVKIQDAIQKLSDSIPNDLIIQKHIELFDQRKVEYFVFPKSMSDEEIIEHVNASGIEVITVRESDKGKMAFYSIPDTNAIKSGLDMAYKLKGEYATDPDKTTNILMPVLVKFMNNGDSNRDPDRV